MTFDPTAGLVSAIAERTRPLSEQVGCPPCASPGSCRTNGACLNAAARIWALERSNAQLLAALEQIIARADQRMGSMVSDDVCGIARAAIEAARTLEGRK